MTRRRAGPTLYIDARSLQGAAAIYDAARQARTALERLRASKLVLSGRRWVALVDEAAPQLDAWRDIFDDCASELADLDATADDAFLSVSATSGRPFFVSPSPDTSVPSAALLYDAGPLFALTPDGRPASAEATLALAWLTRFDRFLVAAPEVAEALQTRLGVGKERIVVAPVPLAGSDLRNGSLPRTARRSLLVVGSGGAFEAVRTALAAHAASRFAGRHHVVVVDDFSPEARQALLEHHTSAGGAAGAVTFAQPSPRRSPELYAEALVVVAAAAPGVAPCAFADAHAAGTPLLAAEGSIDIGRVPPAWRYDALDPASLARLLDHLTVDGGDWERLRLAQREFEAGPLGLSVEDALAGWPAVEASDFASRRYGSGPARIALLAASLPVAQAAGLKALARRAEVHVFAPQPTRFPEGPWAGVSTLPSDRLEGFDAYVHLISDKPSSARVLRRLLAWGGVAILDSRSLVNVMTAALGEPRAAALAGEELGRRVGVDELRGWSEWSEPPRARLLAEVRRAALPLFVVAGAPVLRGGVAPLFRQLPASADPPISLTGARDRRDEERSRLGVAADEILIAAGGDLAAASAPEETLWAFIFLREWGHSVHLIFYGFEDRGRAERLRRLAMEFGHGGGVGFSATPDDGDRARLLAAADVAIQLDLRNDAADATYAFEALASGLPTVTNQGLAEVLGSPRGLIPKPDNISAVLLAEGLLEAIGVAGEGRRPEAAARFVADHDADRFAESLLGELGLAVKDARAA